MPEIQERKLSKLLEKNTPIKLAFRKMDWEKDVISILSICDGFEEVMVTWFYY